MKEKINTYVQLLLDEVELNISVKDNLYKQDGNLENFGYILVSNGTLDPECFWDNLDFFLTVSFGDFREECAEELKKKNFKVKKTYKTIKKLIKRANELNLLTV